MEIWIDTFEQAGGATSQAGVTRSAGLHANSTEGTDDGGNDYSVRTDGTLAGTSLPPVPFTNIQGTFFWITEDIDGILGHNGGAPSDLDVIDWTGIDITGQTDLTFSGYFGASSAANNGGFSHYEATDFISIQVQIDGGGYVEILRFEGDESLGAGGSGEMRLDTNGDGLGDGALLTEALAQFANIAIAGTGTTLDLRLVVQADGNNEVTAYDNFAINADAGNTAPVLADIEAGAITYQETDGPQVITSTITVADAEDTNIESATIAITGGFDAANDALAFATMGTISGTYVTATGIMTLMGSATLAQYQAALRAVTYENSFTTESAATRTFAFTVNDGDDVSNTVSRDSGFNVDETIDGTVGPDTIAGGFGSDTINAGASDDRLFGQDGNDTLNGNSGNDQLWGMAGADTLNGSTGTDGVFYVIAGAGVAFNSVTGGTGGEAAGDTYSSIEYFHGSNFTDTMDGGAGNDLFYGRNGNDIMNGGEGADRLYGQNDADTINGDGGNDSIYGGSGGDILDGGAGMDLVSGGTGDDMVNGGADDDALYGNGGIDTLNGGDGDDDLYGGADGDTLNGDGDNDNLFGDAGDDTLNGGDGNDNLRAGTGTNTVNGDAGNDIIYAHEGVDDIDGGAGLDRVTYASATSGVGASLDFTLFNVGAAAGDNYTNVENLTGSQFNDSLIGSNDVNVIAGLSGNDFISGLAGNDRLFGGAGDDEFIGGAGNDILFGGAGADTFIYQDDNSYGDDRIFDWEDGTDIIEFFNYSSVTSIANLSFTQIGADVLIEMPGSDADGSILVLNATAANFTDVDFEFNQMPPQDTNEVTDSKKLSQDSIVTALEDEISIDLMAEAEPDYLNGFQPETFDFDGFI